MNKILKDKATIGNIIKVLQKKNYLIYSKGTNNYNLNTVLIRSAVRKGDNFDDLEVVFWRYKDKWEVRYFAITTDPGRTYRLKPINNKGTAILLPQQVIGGWQLGIHKGYEALVQAKPFNVLRDNDLDDKLGEFIMYDYPNLLRKYKSRSINKDLYIYNDRWDKIAVLERCMCGINNHRASKWKILEHIGLYSAGCQVHQDPYRFRKEFLPLYKASANIYGNSFTFSLITEYDLDNLK